MIAGRDSRVPAAPEPALAGPPRHPRFPAADGVRALAALGVVAIHAQMLAGPAPSNPLLTHFVSRLGLSVSLFFVLSGFLLYRPFIAHRTGGPDRPLLADYARNRLLRIYPAYLVALVAMLLIPGLRADLGWHDLPLLTLATGRAACLRHVFSCGLIQCWSLVAELTFYLVLPLYIALLRRACRGRSLRAWVSIELAALLALSGGGTWLHFAGPQSGFLAWSAAPYALWFALGMGLAVVSVARTGPDGGRAAFVRGHPDLLWLPAAGVLVWLCLALPGSPYLFTGSQQRLEYLGDGAVAVLVVAAVVLGSGGHMQRLLSSRPLAWLGLVSYGIFLWHLAIIDRFAGDSFLVLLAVGTAGAIVCGAVSYRFVERPALRLKYRWLRGGSAAGARPR